MTVATYCMEMLTPCFCAGANQSVAEIRAASIRGRLRWWFRVLGGTREQETEVFGSVFNGGERGSSVVVRVRTLATVAWTPVEFAPNSNAGYVLYFAKASAAGVRWKSQGALAPGSQFELLLSWLRRVSPSSQAIFDLSLECFLLLGSLGLRSTRGFGAFDCHQRPFSIDAFPAFLERIRKCSPQFLADIGQFDGCRAQLMDGLGAQLRGLRQGYSAGRPGRANPTPLGSSQNPRQASAVYLRPVKVDSDHFRLVVFEAPAQRVLGMESRKGAPRLGNGVPLPGHSPAGHGGGRRR